MDAVDDVLLAVSNVSIRLDKPKYHAVEIERLSKLRGPLKFPLAKRLGRRNAAQLRSGAGASGGGMDGQELLPYRHQSFLPALSSSPSLVAASPWHVRGASVHSTDSLTA